MEEIVYFGNGCPKCEILKKKLEDKEVNYKVGELQEIINAGFRNVPVLKINNEYLDFAKAINYINNYRKAGD